MCVVVVFQGNPMQALGLKILAIGLLSSPKAEIQNF